MRRHRCPAAVPRRLRRWVPASCRRKVASQCSNPAALNLGSAAGQDAPPPLTQRPDVPGGAAELEKARGRLRGTVEAAYANFVRMEQPLQAQLLAYLASKPQARLQSWALLHPCTGVRSCVRVPLHCHVKAFSVTGLFFKSAVRMRACGSAKTRTAAMPGMSWLIAQVSAYCVYGGQSSRNLTLCVC